MSSYLLRIPHRLGRRGVDGNQTQEGRKKQESWKQGHTLTFRTTRSDYAESARVVYGPGFIDARGRYRSEGPVRGGCRRQSAQERERLDGPSRGGDRVRIG